MYLDARSINRRSKTDVTMFSSTHFRILFASQYFPDKAWARDILCLRVKCNRNDRGCDWIGQLGHAEVCNVLFSLFSGLTSWDKLSHTLEYSISLKSTTPLIDNWCVQTLGNKIRFLESWNMPPPPPPPPPPPGKQCWFFDFLDCTCKNHSGYTT